MKLRAWTAEEMRVSGLVSTPPEAETRLLEALREEVSAAQSISRKALLDRVCARRAREEMGAEALRPAGERALESLLRGGDLLEGQRGRLGPAPLRIVELPDGGLVLLGGLPTVAVNGDVQAGVPRRLVGDPVGGDGWRAWLSARGGVWLSAAQWSGVGRTSGWQEWLDELSWRRAVNDHMGAGPWGWPMREELVIDPGRRLRPRRWRPAREATPATPTLIRTRREHGWAYGLVWTEQGTTRGMTLSPDEGRRTYCALSAAVGCRVPYRTEQEGAHVTLTFEPWLPGAMRRALWVCAERADSASPWRWRLSQENWRALRPRIEASTGMIEESD